MKRTRARAIFDEVSRVMSRWPDYAEEVGVAADWRDRIFRTLRVEEIT
jgi:hypothetical protein